MDEESIKSLKNQVKSLQNKTSGKPEGASIERNQHYQRIQPDETRLLLKMLLVLRAEKTRILAETLPVQPIKCN